MTNIANAKRDDNTDDQHDDGTTKGTEPFALTNQNLMFYPLARNRHSNNVMDWVSDKSGRWLYDLTNHIQFRLPANTEAERRCGPTAFDMSILLQALALERIKGQHEFFEVTASGLIRGIGLTVTGANLKRLETSLWLWANLVIQHRHWYSKGKHSARLLPPPLTCEQGQGHRLRISVDANWIWKGNTVPVPFPLPNEATAQGLVLYLLAQWQPVIERDSAMLCAKLGLRSHDENRNRLRRALAAAKHWYGEHGGGFKAAIDHRGRIRFTIAQPQLVWNRLEQQQFGIEREQANEMLREVTEVGRGR